MNLTQKELNRADELSRLYRYMRDLAKLGMSWEQMARLETIAEQYSKWYRLPLCESMKTYRQLESLRYKCGFDFRLKSVNNGWQLFLRKTGAPEEPEIALDIPNQELINYSI
ncbi:MAG TPA: hypothetical protein PL028_02150 [Bacteroidales bacterium]|jgi:hypothetical protein|nr:hypothetical protein [Bacteroidales bacterium]